MDGDNAHLVDISRVKRVRGEPKRVGLLTLTRRHLTAWAAGPRTSVGRLGLGPVVVPGCLRELHVPATVVLGLRIRAEAAAAAAETETGAAVVVVVP